MQTGTISLIENKREVPKEFNKIAARYDLATSMSQGYSSDLAYSVSLLSLKGNEKVLDLCCGTGKSTEALLKSLRNGKVIGLDNSEGMLQEARRKFVGELSRGQVSFTLQDAMNPAFPDESFDVIFAAYGLRNMPDYGLFLQNTYRLLKPGGKLCIHDYSLADNAWAKPYWAVLGYGFIVPFCTVVTGSSGIFTYLVNSVLHFPSPRQIEALMQEAAYKDVKAYAHRSWRSPILHSFIATK